MLLVIVPVTYRLFRGDRAPLATNVAITVGALSAAFGIIQYMISATTTWAGGRRARSEPR